MSAGSRASSGLLVEGPCVPSSLQSVVQIDRNIMALIFESFKNLNVSAEILFA